MLILSSIDELRQLRDSSDETSMIMIPNGDQRLVLKEVRSKQKIAMSLGDGNTAPIYVGSAGRTLLAQYTDKELNKILGKIRVAVPVKGYFFPVVLCVMGLKVRFKPTSILDELKESAIRISDKLFQGIEG
jgi:DNA-binding IclR family transcriptional regulator